MVARDGTVCVSDVVVDTLEGMKPVEDTSLSEAAKVMFPVSQEHGEPSGEQQYESVASPH